jgi:hypothetical protein
MPEAWLLCYIWRDVEGQDYRPHQFGKARYALFREYPVECWSEEVPSGTTGRVTEGMIVETYAYNRGGEQYVRFTYRIQLDGDYINNCAQENLGVMPG